MQRLLIIDSHSIIHRAYHALPPLTTPNGVPAHAVYGVARLLLSLRRAAPDYIIAAGDTPVATFRAESFAAYKAHRAPTPDDLSVQFGPAKALCETFGVRLFERDGMEADDVIATIVDRYRDEPDLRIEILSSDSDLFQLVSGDRVVVRTFSKGVSETVPYDETAVRARYQIAPAQLIDYKALVGDTSDNIPGLPGIGPKTAQALLKQYESIEGIYAHLDDLPKLRDKLVTHHDALLRDRNLVQLRHDVPLTLPPLAALSWHTLDTPALERTFTELGFNSLLQSLRMSATAPVSKTKSTPAKRSATSRTSSRMHTEAPTSSTQQQTLGLGETAYLPPTHSTPDAIYVGAEPLEAGAAARPIPKIGIALKEYLRRCWVRGEDLAEPYEDLGIALSLLEPDRKSYTLTDALTDFEMLDLAPTEQLPALRAALREALRERGIEMLFLETEMPLIRILAQMESWGILLNRSRLDALDTTSAAVCSDLEQQIYQAAGVVFNINSPKQVGDVLFTRLGLAPKGRSASTRADVLDMLTHAHPVVPLIQSYREHFKMRSTYILPLRELSDDQGFVHTDYVQTGAGTGRLSSRNPNLQNIPQESPWSRELRDAFEAREGYSLVACDYTQLELRILAGISNDPELVRAFRHGEDVHRHTASLIFNVALADVTPEQRRLAKTLNFGLVYGMGQTAFAKATGVSRAQAKTFIETYFERFAGVRTWQMETIANARRDGYASTLTGRRRYFPALANGPSWMAAEAERAAINHPVQGLEADVIKRAMIAARDVLVAADAWGTDARMLLTIHDELLFEIRDAACARHIPVIRQAMEGVLPELDIPLTLSVRTGKRWGSLTEYA